VLLLAEFPVRAVPWALWRLMRGSGALRAQPGLRFAKVLGSGRGGGFGLMPGLAHQGLMAFFDDEEHARHYARQSTLLQAYGARAAQTLVLVLRVVSSRGSWGGHAAVAASARSDKTTALRSVSFTSSAPGTTHPNSPIAVLTRASIRPSRAAAFWGHAAPTHRAIAQAQGCQLAVGLGEAPLLRQATFSLWDNTAAVDRYAHQGAHHQASTRAWQHQWFSESMFTRFEPVLMVGHWKGRRYDRTAI
jgi:spheroidene monooxygenase